MPTIVTDTCGCQVVITHQDGVGLESAWRRCALHDAARRFAEFVAAYDAGPLGQEATLAIQ